jgi:hypothetical protein
MGLSDIPLRRCVTGEETSAYVLFECKASATLRHWVPFSWTLRMLELYILGQSGTLLKEQSPHNWDVILRGTKGLRKPTCNGIPLPPPPKKKIGSNPLIILFVSKKSK